MKELKNRYPKIHNVLFNPDYLTIRYWVIGITLALIISYFYSIRKNKETETYKASKITFGVIDESHGRVTYGHGPYFDFHYFNEMNQKIHIKKHWFFGRYTEVSHKCYNHRKKGDTMVIEYSLIDSTYARVISCYWNESLKREYKLKNVVRDLKKSLNP